MIKIVGGILKATAMFHWLMGTQDLHHKNEQKTKKKEKIEPKKQDALHRIFTSTTIIIISGLFLVCNENIEGSW